RLLTLLFSVLPAPCPGRASAPGGERSSQTSPAAPWPGPQAAGTGRGWWPPGPPSGCSTPPDCPCAPGAFGEYTPPPGAAQPGPGPPRPPPRLAPAFHGRGCPPDRPPG